MAESEEAGLYGLVMPFVVVISKGGPYDDQSFVAGVRYSDVANTLKAKPETYVTYEYPALVPQLDLLAMHEGYTLDTEPWAEWPGEWVLCHFRRTTYDESEMHDRTPFVVVELQLRPSIPETARPYWWGYHDLKFTMPDGTVVWRGNIECADRSSESARVEYRKGFGWVLVLVLRHEKADKALASMHLPRFIAALQSGDTKEGSNG